jgi:ATP-dependent helicase/nuclease subunit B
VDAALFLSMEREGVKPVGIEADLRELADAARMRLAAVYDALHGDGSLTAQGVATVCEYCEVRGLCRRNFWP